MNAQHNRFLETADRIGRRLCRDAVWSDGSCNWLGWSMELVNNAWTPAYRAFGPDLYNGTSGIALFLARLYEHTGDRIERDTAAAALAQAADGLDQIPPAMRSGFYTGGAGAASALIEAGKILEDEDLVGRGFDELIGLREVAPDDKLTDVISGSAGLIPLLVDIAERFGRDELMEIAIGRGEQFLRLAEPTERGLEWKTMPVAGQGALTGYSHGVAGIINAMLELYAATGDRRYHEAALGGLRFERSHFSAEHGNWADLRVCDPPPPPDTPAYGTAWCHGAPGVGMARLRTHTLLPEDAQVLEEIDVAVRTTAVALARPVTPGQGNFSLCHGAAGNAELLLLAADRFGRIDLRQAAENVGEFGITMFEGPAIPWPCGVLNSGETPNLMLGLAGIGYFYLRLHDSAEVPTVLLVKA